MNAVFVDTFFYLAVLAEDDAAHRRAMRTAQQLHVRTVTTAWVLTEVADALAAPDQRGLFTSLLASLRGNPNVTIVPPTQDLFDAGLDLYAHRPDKDWSLTDCVSFIVMREYGLSDALTADHHFEQAGFRALLA